MRNYLLERGIPDKSIKVELMSLDTAGAAVFSKHYCELYGLNAEGFVTHSYHKPRASEIFNFVFGRDIECFAVSGNPDSDFDWKAEHRSLTSFKKTFEGIQPGDLKSILEQLYRRHPFYRKV
jgi:hypothetical protein